jgi:thiol-disulfide isomerase/thioredoxin
MIKHRVLYLEAFALGSPIDVGLRPLRAFPIISLIFVLGSPYNPVVSKGRIMSRSIDAERELHEIVKAGDDVFVLFYASWCPFSQRFLPVYEKLARDREHKFVRILVDNNEDLCRQFAIDVYPTVLFFKSGKVSKRLDGTYHVGLNERQMTDLIEACSPRTK